MEMNKHKDELLFVPLGGAGEIGLNLNLYHYKGKWIIMDFGAGFADDYLPGVDMIVPDISFILKHKKDILAIILTHAHEDHLGAVQYLWDEIQCPIYTTSFTAAFLKAKLTEYGLSRKVPIIEVPQGGRIDLAPFVIEYVPLSHSAPEMQAAFIKTDVGNIMHTGDWKFDHDPLIGSPNDEKLLKQYGDEGILALVGDSTNVFNEGFSGSEGDLKGSIVGLVAKCDKLVVVTTFASNIARIDTIVKAAAECGRRVVLAGRSLWRVVNAAKETGYLNDFPELLDDRSFDKYPREQILVLCTGCQGEPMAAATKMANQNHTIKLKPGDHMIFSSKIIPGNEKKIYRQFNQLTKLGVNLYTEKTHFVHVSGHPYREELKKMYELIRPEIAIPVHGEIVHIHEHAQLALNSGVKQAICVENGDVIKLAPGKAEKIAMVDSGYLAVDGNYLLSADSHVMRARRKIQNHGAIIATLLMSANSNDFRANPIIAAPGSLDPKEDGDLIIEIITEIKFVINEKFNQTQKNRNKNDRFSNEEISAQAKSIIKRIIKREVGKEPLIEVHIERI